eukprot:934848-Amphidinium_carterae.1
MKYVQSQATGGDSTATTLLNECLVNLELTKEKAISAPVPVPLPPGGVKEEQDEDMEDGEPSAKKKKSMGSGTPASPISPQDLTSPGGEERAPAGEIAATGSADVPSAAQEEDLQAVLASVDSGEDWSSAARKRAGRPPKPPVMAPGSLTST